jgi:hypothetical protein
MPKFMLPETALCRVVEDPAAPIRARVQALQQLAHPPLCMLRRLLVDTSKRKKPVPSKLLAAAALKYAYEVRFRKTNAAKAGQAIGPNLLGIQ